MEVDYEQLYDSGLYRQTKVQVEQNHVDYAALYFHPTYRSFFKHVRPTGDKTLLDFGCGPGVFGKLAIMKGWRVFGYDISATALEHAGEKGIIPIHKLEEKCEVGGFDVVTAFEVLEYQACPLEFLNVIKNLLKDGGLFFCTVPNWESERVRNTRDPEHLPPVHKLFFSVKSLKKLADAAGFKNIEIGKIWTNEFPRSIRTAKIWLNRMLGGIENEPIGLWIKAGR